MNQSPPAILRALLLTQVGLVNVPGDKNTIWPCYVSAMPDGDAIPNDAAAIYGLAGTKQGRQMEGPVLERWAGQIKTRAVDYTAGWAKLQAIIAFMDELTGVTVTLGSFAYHVPSITRGVPLTLGPEPGTKRRFLFTVNVSFVCTETGI
jgi:hypothetical protein